MRGRKRRLRNPCEPEGRDASRDSWTRLCAQRALCQRAAGAVRRRSHQDRAAEGRRSASEVAQAPRRHVGVRPTAFGLPTSTDPRNCQCPSGAGCASGKMCRPSHSPSACRPRSSSGMSSRAMGRPPRADVRSILKSHHAPILVSTTTSIRLDGLGHIAHA